MSAQLIARSPDLSRLRSEGYEVDVRGDHVVVANIPYVRADRTVGRGCLVVPLTTSGERTGPPRDHTAWWTGEMPCFQNGQPISRISAGGGRNELAPGLVVEHYFSSKPMPAGRYPDYYEQFVSYIRIIAHEAQALHPSATAQTYAPAVLSEGESVFRYHDSASSRAGITMANQKLALPRVAIVGLGGTGSYVLDLVAKTPVEEIHLFDGDLLLNHNAFRAPGAVPLEALKAQPFKVEYYAALYTQMHRGVVAHPVRLTAENADQLDGMSFVFLCMDGGPDKEAVVTRLEAAGIAFIDVGMGIGEDDGVISGILRVTTSVAANRAQARTRISFDDPDDEVNEYAQNIQVADLNSLNACLAVLRWKRLYGFYSDLEHEHNALFTIDGNDLLNEDHA